ncbi:MAG: mannose-1-phosphate guanylyltransferase, partial [Bacteroidales bacterium 45-6]
TFDRFNKIIPAENIFIVTKEAYYELVKEQLPEWDSTQILLEPMRRNTAPCIAYASYRINEIDPEANIVVAPSDHLILNEDAFLKTIEEAFSYVERNEILLTLGIKPSRPETGYGYIQMSEEKVDGVNRIKVFTEKPNFELAKVFYESGEFVWNSGLFIWNVKTILKSFHDHLPDVASKFDAGVGVLNTPGEQAFINENYPFCPNISIDYGIMEKAPNGCVLAANFGWSDLGTWGSLHEISEKDEHANAALSAKVLFFDSTENIVALPEDKLAVLQGLNGYIVAESQGVLLVCKKSEEQRIKQFVADVKFKYGEDYV